MNNPTLVKEYNLDFIIKFNNYLMEDKHRIAIVNPEKCKPKRCKQ